MNDKQFYDLYSGALEESCREVYVTDWVQSSIWNDDEYYEISQERIEAVGAIWDMAHASMKDIRACTGLSQFGFAQRFCIPKRTVEDWEAGRRTCPPYVHLLLAQAVNMYKREEQDIS